MVTLGRAGHDRALDDGGEAIGQLIEDAFDDAGVTGAIHPALRCGHGDVRHVDVVGDIGEGGSSHRVMDEQVVSVGEPVLDGTADDTCSDDADLHQDGRLTLSTKAYSIGFGYSSEPEIDEIDRFCWPEMESEGE